MRYLIFMGSAALVAGLIHACYLGMVAKEQAETACYEKGGYPIYGQHGLPVCLSGQILIPKR